MAVLISSIVKGQTREGYDSVLMAVHEEVKKAPGFIFHCACPDPSVDGWIVTEVWQSKKEADQWFAKFVVPISRMVFIRRGHIMSCMRW